MKFDKNTVQSIAIQYISLIMYMKRLVLENLHRILRNNVHFVAHRNTHYGVKFH